jgi:Leucine-rich repeat (LRR) protein
MDESLQLLPAVEALDLSRNNLAKVANLQKCLRLKFLDLGFNHITSVASLNEVQVQIYQNMDMGTSSLHLSVLSWQAGKKNCTVVHSDLHSL